MSDALAEEGIMLLLNSKISDFNYWRMKKNLTIKLDISNRNFSGKDLSQAYLNGVSCVGTDFSHCNLSKVNFVQAILNKANFEGANLTDTLLMYAEMEECNLVNSDVTRTNFTGSKFFKTILVEANMKDVRISKVDKKDAYLKYAKIEGTPWEVADSNG